MTEGLRVAHATLLRGVAFLERRAGDGADARDLTPAPQQARVVGNHLRELDAFLTVMLDAAARRLGAAASERRRFRRRKNTHRKLRGVLGIGSVQLADEDHLCAAASLRFCLHAEGGRLERVDRDMLTHHAGSLGAQLGEDRLIVPLAALLSICALYRSAGSQIIAAVSAAGGREIDFSPLSAHLVCANVACDGF